MRYFWLLLPVLLLSCGDRDASDPATLLAGEWEQVSVRIRMNSFRNSDSVKLVEIAPGEWERYMGTRPVRTVYYPNGTYVTSHYNLSDSLFFQPAGTWSLHGDSLLVRDTFPERGNIYRYLLRFTEQQVELSGREDMDGDGASDDDFRGILVRRTR